MSWPNRYTGMGSEGIASEVDSIAEAWCPNGTCHPEPVLHRLRQAAAIMRNPDAFCYLCGCVAPVPGHRWTCEDCIADMQQR
jgi:hypothetical protein